MEFTAEITLHTKRPLTEDALLDFAQIGGVAVGHVGGREVELTFTVNAPNVSTAFERAIATASSRNGTIVAVSVMTTAEADRRAEDGLVGVGEVAELLKVSKQRVNSVSKTAGFPQPIAELSSTPIWRKSAIMAFNKAWSRKPGRPKKSA